MTGKSPSVLQREDNSDVHRFKDTGEAPESPEGENNGKGQPSRQEGWSRALEPEKSVDD